MKKHQELDSPVLAKEFKLSTSLLTVGLNLLMLIFLLLAI